tara:strand:- start:339 stop:536 length:198 start_codon:yes stop_codon:yes gene_type:complete
MLPDEMEAEKNRKLLLSQADTIEVLKRNVHDLQESLAVCHKRIKELTEQECFCGLADEPLLAGRD